MTDAASGDPIGGATVLVIWVRGYQVESRTAVTDEGGVYALSAPGVICESLSVSVGGSGYVTIELQDLACTSEAQVLDFELEAG